MNDSRYRKTVKPDECALITERFARRLAYPFACLAFRLGWSANAVTLLAGFCWMASLPLVAVAGWLLGTGRTAAGWTLWLSCGVLWNAGYVLDLADGSLARMSGTARPSGFYLDYLFHLLFKPAFLSSLGVALYLAQGRGFGLLALALLAIPANWSASASAAEHVLCEETGKGRQSRDPATDEEARRRLWLGVTDSHATASGKARGPLAVLRVVAQEVLSYYGQFSFFSLLVLLDFACWHGGIGMPLPLTTASFVLLTLALSARVPFRALRDFRRIREGLDPPNEG